ncbi:hypothetical protein GCM10023205_07030 [Yinghuangia aomiensis]|uniref:Uncharacterized protein n=1 Tax=Yinghuangia aomiensis TaxID=676205 RepID=A0ABP9GP78_9ACTN
MSDQLYRVDFTEAAAEVRDSLPAERRAMLDRGVRVLARDPFNKTATGPIGPDDSYRKAYVAPGLVLEYTVVAQVLVVIVMQLFDETAYLIDQDI